MKRKLSALLFAALLLVVSGCSNAVTEVKEEDKAMIEIGDTKITKGDVYTTMVAQGTTTPIEKKMKEILVDKYAKPDEAMEKEAKKSVEDLKANYETPEKFQEELTNAGIKDETEYYNLVLFNARVKKLTDNYINDNFKELSEKYELRKVQIVAITDATKTEEALKEATNGTDFTQIATTYGDTTTYNGAEAVYNSKSGLPEVVWNNIKEAKKNGTLIKKAIVDTSTTTPTYYIVKVTNVKAKDFKEDAITSIKSINANTNQDTQTSQASTELNMDDEAFAYYLKKAGYSIHDVDIYQYLLTSSQKFKRD